MDTAPIQKEWLGLMLTGKVHTFFREDVMPSFQAFLGNLLKTYNVQIVFVTVDKMDPSRLDFITNMGAEYSIERYVEKPDRYKYPPDVLEALLAYEALILTPKMMAKRESELNPNTYISGFIQIDQIAHGYKVLMDTRRPYTVMIRSRMDVHYKDLIVPYSNNHILYPHSSVQEKHHSTLLTSMQIQSDEELCEIIKYYYPIENNLRILPSAYELWFGGAYFENLDILQILKDCPEKEKFWMYCDQILVGRPSVFQYFASFFETYMNADRILNICKTHSINHIFVAEAVFIQFMLMNDVQPIMYLDDGWGLVR